MGALTALATGTLRENGILLWGALGGGKSHLLRATAARAAAKRPIVECSSPAKITSASVPDGALVIVDSIDEADPPAQGRLFTMLNELPSRGGQWLAAASLPPASLPLRDDLRTRVALGLVFEIVPLSDADKSRALSTYARERGFRLSEDVIGYLLAHGRRDMSTLVATLAALDRHSLATQRPITVRLLRDWLQQDPRLAVTGDGLSPGSDDGG